MEIPTVSCRVQVLMAPTRPDLENNIEIERKKKNNLMFLMLKSCFLKHEFVDFSL